MPVPGKLAHTGDAPEARVGDCFYITRSEHFVEGDRGSLEVAPDLWVRVTTAEGTRAQRVPPSKYPWANPDYAVVQASMVACHQDILKGIRGEKPAESEAGQNLKTMRLVFAAYESARTCQSIAVVDP